jgi:hypothetical protein
MVLISHIFSGLGGRHDFSLIILPSRQAAPAMPSDARRFIFWYWFIASFVVVYVYLLSFVFEEEEE